MQKIYSKDRVIESIVSLVALMGNQAKAAERLGVSDSYLSEVIRGTRGPGYKILTGLGWRKVVGYVPESIAQAKEAKLK